jgi:hypothetical protein
MRNQVAIVIILLAMGVIALVTFNSRNAPDEIVLLDPAENSDVGEGYPTFEAYQLHEELYRGNIAAVRYEGQDEARKYESIISDGVKSIGVNFAGQYSVVTWGCGSDCQVSAIVDVVSGTVVEYGILSAYGLAYSPWSSLFIVNPIENIPKDLVDSNSVSSDFYTLHDNAEFTYIRRYVAGGSEGTNCDSVLASARNIFTKELRNFSSNCFIPYGWEIIEDSQ